MEKCRLGFNIQAELGERNILHAMPVTSVSIQLSEIYNSTSVYNSLYFTFLCKFTCTCPKCECALVSYYSKYCFIPEIQVVV